MEETLIQPPDPVTPPVAPTPDSSTPLDPSRSEPKKPKNIPAMILSFLLLISLSISGYFGYQYYQTSQPEEHSHEAQSSPTPAPTHDSTASWETFNSSVFHYSFSYPNDWSLLTWNEVVGGIGTHSLSNYDVVKIEEYMDHGTVNWNGFIGNDEAIKLDISISKTPYRSESPMLADHNIIIAGKIPTVYKVANLGAGPAEDLIVINIKTLSGDNLIIAVYGFKLNAEDILSSDSWDTIDQVLSTFQFTKE